jgi:hypothetical protein
VALLPLTLGASWYLAADENRFLTLGRVWSELVLFAVAVAPFLAAAVAFVSVLGVGGGWVRACRVRRCGRAASACWPSAPRGFPPAGSEAARSVQLRRR